MNDRPTVMVSGASRGLGRAIALGLAERYAVIGFARGPVTAMSNDPRAAWVSHRDGIDITRTADLQRLAPDLAECDALVNNAGVAYEGLLAMQSLDSIEHVVRVNLSSVLYLTKLYTRARLAARKPGTVVTIGSITAIRGFSGLAVYGATKGALVSMTKALARELGPKGFRFTAVLPGYIDTDMSNTLSARQREQIVRRTPLGRLATVGDIVPVVRFLLSSEAAFITGETIVVDGGLSA